MRRSRIIVLVAALCCTMSLGSVTGQLTQAPALPTHPGEGPVNMSSLGSSGWMYQRDSVPDGSGGFYIGGSMNGPLTIGNTTIPSHSQNRAFVAHMRHDGVWDWAEAASGSDWSEVQALEAGPSGSVYLMMRSRGGFTIQGQDFDDGHQDSNDFTAIAHFSASGTLIGKATIGRMSDTWGDAYPIAIEADGDNVYAMVEGRSTIGVGSVTLELNNNNDVAIFNISMVDGTASWAVSATAESLQRTLPNGNTESKGSRVEGFSMGLDKSNGQLIIHGYIESHAKFGAIDVQFPLYSDLKRNFVASLGTDGNWKWVTNTTYPAHHNKNFWANGNIWQTENIGIPFDSMAGEANIMMRHSDNRSFGPNCHPVNGGYILFRFNSVGECTSFTEIHPSTNVNLRTFALLPQGNVLVGGSFQNVINIAGKVLSANAGGNGPYNSAGWIAEIDSSGVAKWATAFNGSGFVEIISIHVGPAANKWIIGRTDGSTNVGGFQISGNVSSIFVMGLGADTDGDGHADIHDSHHLDSSQHSDIDGDGYGDDPQGYRPDSCPTINGTSWRVMFGCVDTDGDGMSDGLDPFPRDSTQWSDLDGDGFGDNLTGVRGDMCPEEPGYSYIDRHGCSDRDQDGWSDQNDLAPDDPYQWGDTDGDGFGDNPLGANGDMCPQIHGNATMDRPGCPDTDGDGWSDEGDVYPNDPNTHGDTDHDGVADGVDPFPLDPTQWSDADGDGCGDNQKGLNPDRFIDDKELCSDLDNDGVGDEEDAFPHDPTQWSDADGDGCGDEPRGISPDAFPEDPDQCSDTDMDGVGDETDAFPFDPSQSVDTDGDGWGDAPGGPRSDAFPEEPTQWSDMDGDGFGDSNDGVKADDCPLIPGNETTDALGCPDSDNDGVSDLNDEFPFDETRWDASDINQTAVNTSATNETMNETNVGTTDLSSATKEAAAQSSTSDSMSPLTIVAVVIAGLMILVILALALPTMRRSPLSGLEQRISKATTAEDLNAIHASASKLLWDQRLETDEFNRIERSIEGRRDHISRGGQQMQQGPGPQPQGQPPPAEAFNAYPQEQWGGGQGPTITTDEWGREWMEDPPGSNQHYFRDQTTGGAWTPWQ